MSEKRPAGVVAVVSGLVLVVLFAVLLIGAPSYRYIDADGERSIDCPSFTPFQHELRSGAFDERAEFCQDARTTRLAHLLAVGLPAAVLLIVGGGAITAGRRDPRP